MKSAKKWFWPIWLAIFMGSTWLAPPAMAAIPLRGIVEGFYGQPWSQEQRLAMLDFLAAHDMNLYIYGPKDDPYHRQKWREPYPRQERRKLRQMIDKADQCGVEFVFAISPGLDICFSGAAGERDRLCLLAKMESLYAMGVRRFALFFDDIENKDGAAQAMLIRRINSAVRQHCPDVKPMFVVPTEYFSADMVEAGQVKEYTKAFVALLPPDIIPFYTGEGVCPEGLTGAEMRKVGNIYRRRMAVWWNYPVNDYQPGKLALGPITDLTAEAGEEMAALVFNPMAEAGLSRIALATGAAYAAAPESYEPEAAWRAALVELYGDLAPEMAVVAEHSQRLENDWAHIGRPDAPRLRRLMDAFWREAAGGAIERAGTQLSQELARVEAAAIEVRQRMPQGHEDALAARLQLLQRLAAADEIARRMVEAECAGLGAEAKGLYQRLREAREALPPPEEVRISDGTARAFLDEALLWYEGRGEKFIR